MFMKLPSFPAKRIVALRERFGWTQAEAGDVLNVTRSCIASWETGRKVPHGTAVRLLQLWDRYPDSMLINLRRMGVGVPDRGRNCPAAPIKTPA